MVRTHNTNDPHQLRCRGAEEIPLCLYDNSMKGCFIQGRFKESFMEIFPDLIPSWPTNNFVQSSWIVEYGGARESSGRQRLI